MSEITLDRAIALLSSDKVKERSDGLADLKHILQQNKQNSELDALNDKACHKIFESLFQFISVERSAFKKANSNSSRSNAQPASRLSSCASVIRIAVDVLLRNLRTKSVRAIIDHVIDTLSAPDERLWEPLRVDYMKCLAILLQFPPHVEHLPVTQWERLMGFCLRSLGSQEDGDAVSSSQIVHRSSSGKFGTDSGRSTPSRNMPTPVATERFVGDESVLEEVLTHVQLLTASPNAPVNVMSERILHELVGYVKSSTSGNAQRVAFSTINTVVTRILFDQSELVRASMLDLIPVIRRLWNTKYIGLKDEMLSTITLCMSILADTAQREPSESLSSLLDSLVDTLYAEYTSRSEKDVFQLDDSIFHHSARQSIRNPVFGPRLGNTKSEHNWTVLWAIAVLIELSEKIAERLIAPQGSEEAMRKKQRLTSIAEDVFRDSFSSSGLKRTCSLQLIPFLIDSQIVVEARASLLERLIPNILDDNSTIASWTMVAIASFVCTHDAKSPSLKGHWQQVWDFTFRASTSQSISRVACHLMSAILDFQLLEYSVVAETTRSMLLSVNLSGPSTISDSSLALWATVTRLNTQMNPGSMLSASKRVCGLLREVWTIGTVTDKIQAAQVATFARPLELLNLLFACTNRPFVLAASRFRGPAGIIGKHWHFCLRNRKLMEYLFHVDNIFNCHDPWDTDDSLSLESSARADPNDNVVLNLLQAKAEAFLQAWQTLSHGESYHVSVDVVQILSSFCIVVFLFTECLPHQPNSASQNLRHHCKHLWVVICSYLAHHEVHFTNACLELICPIFSPAVCSTGSLGALSNGLYDIATPFVEILEQQRQLQKRHASSDHGEFMDLDGPMWTNKELVAERQSIMDLNREALSSFPNFAVLRRCMTIQLSIFKIMTDASRSGGLDDVSLIDYLINLDHADILSAQSYLPHVYRSCSGMKRETILQILEDLGEKCLQSYEVERCESSLCLCIRMMSSFTDSWTINEGDGLSDSAADIYTWFMDVILTKRKASSGVYIALAGFLENVLMSNAAYLNDEFSPSPRTGLFTILRDGDVPVKFGVAESIPRIFGRFLLKDHDSVFDDILSNLPGDTDWKEGIALRLFVLARLASQWHTLLRRSIYHVFETPAQVPRSVEYAQKCLQTVSKTLGLHDAKELFRLFSSQIIFTWTEANSIDSIPFGVFGYTSLKELLIDVQDEVVGQIMMRGRDHETVQLTKHVNIPFVELLNTSLYKAAAYGIARDISIPPEPKSQSKSVESRLRKLFGSDVYLDRLEKQFPQTVATLFRSLGQYEQVERAFSRRPGFQHALGIMKHITSLSSSKSILPANQQPSFRARFFLDELDFLCKRTGYELETIWTPTLASYVCRVLLESIHPALGSLHACSVIRKLRVLVCVAGPVFLRDYPLEMLMHALRPFLTDIHCSEDALGIFWYLLEAGGPYLMENPRFLAEIAASTFVSLRILFASSPGGTTKDAQFEMVLTNARTFHQWFREFLNAYYGRRETHKKPREEARIEEYLRHLVISSIKMAAPGSAFRDDRESLLLMNILRTRHPERRMLSRSVSDLILSLYCVDFRRPLNYHHDVVREDGEALRICPAVWDSLQNPEVGIEYRLWAARVIGKDYAVTGTISDAVLKEQGPSMFGFKDSVSTSDIVQKSKARILQNLCDMLRSNNRLEVGLVERTLQLIVSKLDDYDESEDYSHVIPDSLMNALIWNPYLCPAVSVSTAETYLGQRPLDWNPKFPLADWARNIALFLSNAVPEDPVTGSLSQILRVIPGLAVQLLPYILHEVLLAEFEEDRDTRHTISEIYKDILREVDEDSIPHARLIIDCILYLRDQPRPGERTIVDRDEWLDIDYQEASSAANKCRMRKTSLLFLEIQVSRVNAGSRRSSFAKYDPPSDFLHNLFKNIDDPDFFYGIIQTPSLSSVMERLDYESTGIKNLLFHSAQYDSELQLSGNANSYGILKALNSTNLQGVASSVFSSPGASKDGSGSLDSMLQASMSLQQWDIPVSPVNPSPSAIVYRTLQGINTAGSIAEISPSVDESYTATLGLLASSNKTALSMKDAMRTLSTVTEIGDVLCSTSAKDVDEEWEKIVLRGVSSRDGSSRDIGEALNVREALFSSIKRKDYLKSAFRLSDRDAQLLEVKVIRKSLGITRAHEMSQASLKSAIRLTNLVQPCASLGINIDGAAKYDLANVLWDQGEMTTSIQILQQLNNQNGLSRQSIPINRAELLVTLGHHVAEARLEKPEAIIQQYLSPAVKDLRGRSEGVDASRVFHGFAMFCDQQFQNQDGLEDFKRVEQLRNCKLEELRAFEAVLASAGGSERNRLKMDRARTKQWFELDDREYQRLRRIRDDFLEQCLGNYLLSLQASDRYNNDALRFCAIWFDESDSLTANMAVSKHLDSVPSRKFAPLMNQLSSRLLDDDEDPFQSSLSSLIYRICVEHPFHGMYQVFASSKSRAGREGTSLSRYRAAGKLSEKLKSDTRQGGTWFAIHNANISYVRFAVDQLDEGLRSGSKVPLSRIPTGLRLQNEESVKRIPPPTMEVKLRHDCDYSRVPTLASFLPECRIASGISAPKIVTAVASDGVLYKQLFKGGNDDLRQDAIMEQVFDQVSNLLKEHRATRQRNLGIRTYKVLPLTSNAGIIEFVQNTIPLHDYLLPAHQRYYPNDMKPNDCRKLIADVQKRSFDQRVRTFRQVMEHFHPVMRYFFMENYSSPDDWFSKRLSYTRSTAAISILGHILGLGDRHGHNILLDQNTGEVVHIDLGVAFEQGRILPIPEVVPFRLTRDLVDGMGITKTEGVFRRCCEFTLEALRQESYSIMTILDVLRYDPLYSWTVSPLRMKKMQDNPEAANGPPLLPGATRKTNADEPSEADRALTVVAKKLSKSLSVTATVNELIQQATDERNLAVLYCGWASYF